MAGAALTTLAAIASPLRAPLGGPPRGEGHDRGGTLARVIGATTAVSLWRFLAPGLLALQLRQFPVDGAQTSLTGHVLPSTHYEGAPPAWGLPLAARGVLQVGEPSMDGLRHCGSPSPLSEPRGCGHLPELPGTRLPWSGPRWNPPAYPT